MRINKLYGKLVPLSLRGGTLASKFILLFFISHSYTLSDLGEYALVAAGVSYLGYLLGFDFYTYSSRQIVGASQIPQASYIKNQFSLYFICYLLAILTCSFYFLFFSDKLLIGILFLSLIVLDHLSQEIMRLLVIYEKPLSANFQFFIRNGLWVYVFIAYSLLNQKVPFYYMWLFWIGSEIISILFILKVFNFVPLKDIYKSKIDKNWILFGLKVCFPLLISTLSLRGIFTADRYILGYFQDKQTVGVYSYFSSFSSSIMAFVDAGVVMTYYPLLIKYAKSNEFELFNKTKRKFLSAICVMSLGVAVMLIVTVPFLSEYTGKTEFLKFMPLLYILLAGSFFYCLSLVYHFELYAKNLDARIVWSSIISFSISIALMYLLGRYYSVWGIAVAQVLGFIVLLITKYLYCRKEYE